MIEHMKEARAQQPAENDPYGALVDIVLFESFSGRLARYQPGANTDGDQDDQAVPAYLQVTDTEDDWVKRDFEHIG
jgi:hypothetical protein